MVLKCGHGSLYIVAYVILWSSQALLIKNSQLERNDGTGDRQYPYDILAMILCIEVFKIVFSSVVFFLLSSKDVAASFAAKKKRLFDNFPEGTYLMFPAAIYVIYNGLSFINLKLMEPGTYRVLINIRILFSGLLLHFFLNKALSARQWTGLILLIVACIIEQSSSFSQSDGIMSIIMMSIQGLCSSLGSVYFQWLLQHRDTSDIGVWLKNIYMYFWSIIFNIGAILVFRPDLLFPSVFFTGFDLNSISILIMAGLGGVCTSMVLRHLDVLIKEYANFTEMVVVAVMQHVLFGTPLRVSLILAIIVVCFSLYLYQVPAKPRRNSAETVLSSVALLTS